MTGYYCSYCRHAHPDGYDCPEHQAFAKEHRSRLWPPNNEQKILDLLIHIDLMLQERKETP